MTDALQMTNGLVARAEISFKRPALRAEARKEFGHQMARVLAQNPRLDRLVPGGMGKAISAVLSAATAPTASQKGPAATAQATVARAQVVSTTPRRGFNPKPGM